MTVEEVDPIGVVRKKRLAKGTWKAERRRLLALEKKVRSQLPFALRSDLVVIVLSNLIVPQHLRCGRLCASLLMVIRSSSLLLVFSFSKTTLPNMFIVLFVGLPYSEDPLDPLTTLDCSLKHKDAPLPTKGARFLVALDNIFPKPATFAGS